MPGPHPRPATLPDHARACNGVLAHCHALAQLLEIGVGVGERADDDDFEKRLGEVRAQVHRLEEDITAQGATPVAARAGYRWPGRTGTLNELRATWGILEEQILTSMGPMVATSPPDERMEALGHMDTQALMVRARGRGSTFFPGWA